MLKIKRTYFVLFLMLSPPSITEIERNGRVEYHVPNGYGINEIRVISINGNNKGARELAQKLLSTLHSNYEGITPAEAADTLRALKKARKNLKWHIFKERLLGISK